MKPTRSFWITVLFVATFGIGFTAGYLIRPVLQPDRARMERPSEGRDERFRAHVTERLKLTPEQQDLFFEKMDAHRRQTRAWMTEARDSLHIRIQSETDSLKAELSVFLSESQIEEWERMMRRAMRGGRGPRD